MSFAQDWGGWKVGRERPAEESAGYIMKSACADWSVSLDRFYADGMVFVASGCVRVGACEDGPATIRGDRHKFLH